MAYPNGSEPPPRETFLKPEPNSNSVESIPEGTYSVTVVCDNCTKGNILTLLRGTAVDTAIKETPCKHCGCRTLSNPVRK